MDENFPTPGDVDIEKKEGNKIDDKKLSHNSNNTSYTNRTNKTSSLTMGKPTNRMSQDG